MVKKNLNQAIFEKQIKQLPLETRSLISVRSGWRSLLLSHYVLGIYNNNNCIHAILNALLIRALNYNFDITASNNQGDNALRVAYTIEKEADNFDISNPYYPEYESKAKYRTAIYKSARLTKIMGYIARGEVYQAIIDSASIISECENTNIACYDPEYSPYKYVHNDLEMAKKGKLFLNSPLFNSDADVKYSVNLIKLIKKIDRRLDFYLPFIDRRLKGKNFIEEDLRLQKAIASVSNEKIDQGWEQVLRFIQDSYFGKLSKKVNIARIIFIGPGGSGKTSLIRALNNEEVIIGKEKPTPGISTSKWSWGKDCKIDIRFWDFAGQVTTHAMHKFFLRERCLYILLLTTRDDQELESQAEYWLEHVRLYGNESPVIVVANKIDGDSQTVNFDEQSLISKYPSIITFKKIAAAKYKSNIKINGTSYKILFRGFRNTLISSIKNVVTQYSNELSFSENLIKEELLKINKQDFISISKFIDLCNKKIDNIEETYNLLNFFNNLGIVVHFPDLSEDALLNPKWLTYGVYAILRKAENSEKRGWISKTEIRSHLKMGIKLEDGTILKYSIEKINSLIIECIIKFKLGYNIKRGGTDYLVMPSVLEKEKPPHDFNINETTIHYIFEFDVLLPPYILHAFISKSSDEIINDWVWQTGVVLKDNSNLITALIERFSSRKIDIYVNTNKNKYRKRAVNYLHKLCERFTNIIIGEKGTEQPIYKEWIEIPKIYYSSDSVINYGKSRLISYQILKDTYDDNEKMCRTEYGAFDIKEFFGDYFEDKKYSNSAGHNIYNIQGDFYKAEHDLIHGKFLKAKGDINLNKNNTIDQLKTILNDFVETVAINKESRKEIKDIKIFLDELSKYPDDIETEDVERVTKKFKSKSFLQKIINLSSLPANFITIGDKIIPLLMILKEYLN